jgi:hypothetical protein
MSLRNLFDDDGEFSDELVPRKRLPEPEIEEPVPQDDIIDDGMGGAPMDPNLPANQTRDFRYVDRFVKVKGLPDYGENSQHGGYIMSPGFAEQYILNFLNNKEQKHIWRRAADVMDLSQGDGNENLVKQDQDLFALHVLMKRSGTENDLNLNERTAHIESRSRSQIKTTTNQSAPSGRVGWLSKLFGR